MMCQILFSRKNKKKIISLSSTEFAHSMVSANICAPVFLKKQMAYTNIAEPDQTAPEGASELCLHCL